MTPLQRLSEAARRGALTRKRMTLARGAGALVCSRCPNPAAPGGCYCRSCRAAYMRNYRNGPLYAERKVRRETYILGLLSEAA
jgi:hypothetical protein